MEKFQSRLAFHCVGKQDGRTESWEGSLKILKAGNPWEAEAEARGSCFHLIVGKHAYGNFVCIPNWNVGTELADPGDIFWNEERLRNYTSLREVDACSAAAAIRCLAHHMEDDRHPAPGGTGCVEAAQCRGGKEPPRKK